ncbi:glycoside hydrolase family 128 protein, partial [Aureobasidium melanogenum]
MKSTVLLSAFSLASLGSAAVHGERGFGLQRHQALHSSSSSSKTSTTIKTSTRPASSSLKTSSKATSSSIKSSSKSSSKISSTSKASSSKATSSSTKPATKSSSSTKSSTQTSSTKAATSSASSMSLAFKAGLSGFPSIETTDVFKQQWMPYISWYSNYEPVAPNFDASTHTVVGAPMLWGKGDQCLTNNPDGPVDEWRLGNFTEYVTSGETDPNVFFGFYEPDCDCPSSSHITNVTVGVEKWNQYIKPLRNRGIALGSPPMCTQLDQTWLTNFAAQGVTWDVTSIHVNKPTVADGIKVVEYYASKFGKPVWVSEFTCVNDTNWSSCGDQDTVNSFIDGMVQYFEGNDNVIAYGANNGEGVPGVWNLMTNDWPPQLTATGQHYQSVLKSLASEKC